MVVLYAACCKVNLDDSELRKRFDELENRLEKLEEFCAQMNTNIDALQTVVTALQEQDYVTGVAPIIQGEKEVGYTITFAKALPVTIYQQESLPAPAIGVKQGDDGVYYWMLDGEWLTDEEGNPLRVEGENATDGITPQLRITEGYWEISYDGGESWTQAGKATGEDGENGVDGEPGGDSIFKSVTQDESNVTFRLQSGEEIILPKKSALAITFSEEMPLVFKIGETKWISYTVTGGNERNIVLVEMFDDDNGYTLQFNPTSATAGKIILSTDIPTYSRVIVTVSDGNNTIMVPMDLEMRPVIGKDTVTVVTPGTLSTLLSEYEPTSITKLTIIGNPNDKDIATLNNLPNLAELDLKTTNIKVIPDNAFKENKTLTSIVFS